MKDKIVLINPPFSQVSSPYPAIYHLKNTLIKENINVECIDLNIELCLKVLSKKFLTEIFNAIKKTSNIDDHYIREILYKKSRYIECIDDVINFLQGKDPSFAYKVASRKYLPEGERFEILKFTKNNNILIYDYAVLICTLYIDDIIDIISRTVITDFYLSKYNEKIAKSYKFELLIEECNKNQIPMIFTGIRQ